MTLQDLGALGEILGGIAVIATLFYLAVQLKHVRKETKRASLIEANRVYNDIFLAVINSPDLARVVTKAAKELGSIDAEEQFILTQYLASVINAAEISFDAIANGGFSSDEVGSMEALLNHFFSLPGAAEHWANFHESYTPPFIRRVNDHLADKT